MWKASRCHLCAYKKEIRNNRGSTFWLCLYHLQDEQFPKYPPQPVFACRAYVKAEP